MNLRFTGAKVGDFPVGKSDKMEVVGGVRREQRINEVAEVGEINLADTRIRFPSLSLNSKAYEKGRRVMLGDLAGQGEVLSWRLM